MELWIAITVVAAFLQNVRSALQKHLKGSLSTYGATFVRFGYGFPIALAYIGILSLYYDKPLPEANSRFAVFAFVGGVAQILATISLVSLFSIRNFAASTAFSKTEPIQAAIIGFVILGDSVTIHGLVAILVAVMGVIAITLARFDSNRHSVLDLFRSRSALVGMLSGALFGVSGVSYRGASLSLVGSDFIMNAAFTLTLVTVFQTVIMLAYFMLADREQLIKLVKVWRPSLVVGISGVSASACWFTAMSIQNVAYVKALGQIELVFTLLVSWFLFKERINLLEFIGIVLLVGGIVILTLE